MEITLSCEDYEWLRPLIDGSVRSSALDLTVVPITSGGERHRRAAAGEFDVAEFSLGMYLANWNDWDFTAIPAFPRRFFPHSRVVVNAEAGIESPADLEDKRVGIQYYGNTLAIWARGVFADRYDLDIEAVEWYTTKPEPLEIDLPPEVVGRVDRKEAPSLVARGELDALVLSKTAELYPLPDGVERLFPDSEAVERVYYAETGFYPVMHNVVVRDEVVAEHPWVPTELVKLMRRSVDAAAERARFEAKYPLVWWQRYREREQELFGDLWGRSFEFDANAAELETLSRYAHELGLTDELLDPAELYLHGDDLL